MTKAAGPGPVRARTGDGAHPRRDRHGRRPAARPPPAQRPRPGPGRGDRPGAPGAVRPLLAPLRAFDAAAGLLRDLAGRGWTIVLASSASGRDLEVMRRVLDADDVIDAATRADDVDASKPAPDLVRSALTKVGAGPGEAVFVGDTPWDVKAAARVGVPCVAVLSGGFGEAVLRSAGAVEVHADAARLLSGLDRSILAAPAAPGRRRVGPGQVEVAP
ncbi:HAD family hydrolase [Kitasatospora sp. NPDC098663]|uniref:HAD family hydrolase n=1 Tax=Kitasatospora sp. NPDC098663 TaxID=3364096 RepID=UPI00380294C2